MERINHYSAHEPDGLQKVHEQMENCVSKLKESLSPKQEPVFTECENAYALVDGETMYCYYRAGFADAVFYLSGCCIWKKQSLVLGRSPYQWQHEPVLYGWKKNGRHQWYTGRKETTIWEFDKPKKNGDHPTMKPIPLLAYPIGNSSMANSVVLDPFGGSGSTLIACEQTDRICRTIELDEKFCDVIVNRYIEQVGSADGVTVLRDGKTWKCEEVRNAL